jgi:hypothetical protein
MIRREAIEELTRTKAADFAERQGALLGRMLSLAESAANNADEMLRSPLSEQRVLKEGDNGEDVTAIILPVLSGLSLDEQRQLQAFLNRVGLKPC